MFYYLIRCVKDVFVTVLDYTLYACNRIALSIKCDMKPVVYYYTNNKWKKQYISQKTIDSYFIKVNKVFSDIMRTCYNYVKMDVEYYKIVYNHNNRKYKVVYTENHDYAFDIIKKIKNGSNLVNKRIVYACGIHDNKEDDITNQIIEVSGPYHNFYSEFGVCYNLDILNKLLCKDYNKLRIIDDDCSVYEFNKFDDIVL